MLVYQRVFPLECLTRFSETSAWNLPGGAKRRLTIGKRTPIPKGSRNGCRFWSPVYNRHSFPPYVFSLHCQYIKIAGEWMFEWILFRIILPKMVIIWWWEATWPTITSPYLFTSFSTPVLAKNTSKTPLRVRLATHAQHWLAWRWDVHFL